MRIPLQRHREPRESTEWTPRRGAPTLTRPNYNQNPDRTSERMALDRKQLEEERRRQMELLLGPGTIEPEVICTRAATRNKTCTAPTNQTAVAVNWLYLLTKSA